MCTRIWWVLPVSNRHSISVHMAHVRHPLVGDPVYSRLANPRGATVDLSEMLRGFRRQALHAEKLAFAHPASGETITVEAAAPADMQSLIAALRADSAMHKI
jgi:23S rRNA pseudouridine1911/1915/1917 synthase